METTVTSSTGFYPASAPLADAHRVSAADCERMLSEWFGQPVVLLASGRSGLVLWLQALGFARYHHRVELPRYLSRCVLNAVTTGAFPVEAGSRTDGVILYHQYGFPQRSRMTDRHVLEDIAHAFFASAATGTREWTSDVALFSLRKFFGTAGMAGGLVVRNREIEHRIRQLVDLAPAVDDKTRVWMRRVIAPAFSGRLDRAAGVIVDGAYEMLLSVARPTDDDLAGLPTSIAGLRKIGAERLGRAEFYRAHLGRAVCPDDFWPSSEELVPFAVPFFGDGEPERLSRIVVRLAALGVETDVYHVDIRRNQRNADYRPCVLLPCHQDLSLDRLGEICEAVRSVVA